MLLYVIVTFRYTYEGGSARIDSRVIDQGTDIDRLTASAVDTARKWSQDPESFDGPEASHLATFYVIDEQTLQTFDELKFSEPNCVEHLGTLTVRKEPMGDQRLMLPNPRLARLLATRLEEAA